MDSLRVTHQDHRTFSLIPFEGILKCSVQQPFHFGKQGNAKTGQPGAQIRQMMLVFLLRGKQLIARDLKIKFCASIRDEMHAPHSFMLRFGAFHRKTLRGGPGIFESQPKMRVTEEAPGFHTRQYNIPPPPVRMNPAIAAGFMVGHTFFFCLSHNFRSSGLSASNCPGSISLTMR